MEKNKNMKSGNKKAQPEKNPVQKKKTDDNPVIVPSSFPEKMKFYGGKAAAVFNKYKKPVATVISYIIPVLIFLYVASIVIYFITSAYRAEFHSDCTDTILWANASIEGNAVYDKDFNYACFLPFGINVIMQPLIGMFGLTNKTGYKASKAKN